MIDNSNEMKGKILIVDDDSLNNLILRNALNDLYEIEVSLSGADALKILNYFDPDIVLLDIMMLTMNGYEVSRKIRQKYPDKNIKIIFLSSKMNLKDRLNGYEAGADDYISKPYDVVELLTKIKIFMNLKLTQDRLVESNNRLETLNNTLETQVRIRTEQLLESEKLSSIGKYTAGIVHNLNNPLAAIIGYSQLLLMSSKIKGNADLESSISYILKSSDLMKEIIASILTKGKPESNLKEEKIDLNEVLKMQIGILNANSFFKYQVKLDLRLGKIPFVKGVYIHFSQSLGNIINNAVDAMYTSPKKVLSISTNLVGGKIVVDIQDTGCGIPKENLTKIYDPFFTTKPLCIDSERPSGTGLGMASSRQMLESYNGEIHIESEIEKGSLFRITLPVTRTLNE